MAQKQTEATILTGQILKYLDQNHRQDVYAWRNNTVGIPDGKGHLRTASKTGISDVIAVSRGLFIGIEVKTGKDRLSPAQIGFIKNIEHVAGIALVVHNYEDFLGKWKLLMIYLKALPDRAIPAFA